jgi:hypothetical protein
VTLGDGARPIAVLLVSTIVDYIREPRALVGHRPLLVPIAAVLVLDPAGRALLQLRVLTVLLARRPDLVPAVR